MNPKIKGKSMSTIKVLNEEVANRIAAGEVVERPVSVVKELVENAIDSQANKIIITIEKGGRDFIQVIDNGHGMNENEAMLAFERHATSKIRTVQDIFNISTLGFRGEALPSIASVSHTILITKDKKSNIATKIEFKGGKLKNFEKTAAKNGTSVTVKRLFHNVPARRKFLRTAQSEYNHILRYIHYQSIVHPEIHFVFNSNGKEKLNYPRVKSKYKRMLEVFGKTFFNQDVIEIKNETSNIKVSGYIYGLEEDRQNIHDVRYVFVNGRFIKDKIILHAIKAAYEPFIKKYRIKKQGKTPPYIVFLEVEPEKVDFNVHPAKLELRFKETQLVHSFVKSTITQALLHYEETKFKQIKDKIMKTQPSSNSSSSFDKKIFKNKTEKKRYKYLKKEVDNFYQPDLFESNKIEKNKSIKSKIELFDREPPEINLRKEEDVVNPWQLHNSYILVQVEDGLMIIDQHAAHERVIYEKIIHRIHGTPPITQKLLFPLVIDIPPYMKDIISDLIQENKEIFEKVGFKLKSFSGDSIVIDAIPTELGDWQSGKVFIEILSQLQKEFEKTENFRESLAKSISCKAAIKAGQHLTKKEMVSLINDLFACEVPYFCPHGRPLIIKMTLDEMEKRFKRIE